MSIWHITQIISSSVQTGLNANTHRAGLASAGFPGTRLYSNYPAVRRFRAVGKKYTKYETMILINNLLYLMSQLNLVFSMFTV